MVMSFVHISSEYSGIKILKGLFSILYLWDSSAMYSWERELKLFNKVYTFDPVDSEKYKIEYKPNFYLKSDVNPKCDKKNDLFFTGKFSAEDCF